MAEAAVKQFPFHWEGTDKRGNRVKGKTVAVSETAVRTELRRQGVSPTRIKKQRGRLSEGKITPNDIDKGLVEEKDLEKRKKIWASSKEVGIGLRGGLLDLRRLRNECVRALGYPDFFSYMASEYGTTTAELAGSPATYSECGSGMVTWSVES